MSEPPEQQIQLGPASPQTLDALELLVDLGPGGAYGGAYGHDSVNLNYELEIRWTVDGSPVPEVNEERTVPSDLTSKGQVWQAQVRAVSGDLAGPIARAELQILNTPPSASLTLEPVPPADQDLVVEIQGSDVDQDSVTFSYSWTRDGELTTWTSDTVPMSATARGEIWEVSVIPHDGEQRRKRDRHGKHRQRLAGSLAGGNPAL